MCTLNPSREIHALSIMGGGPRVVVSTAAFHARVRGSVPGLGGLKEAKMFLPHPRVKVSIVGSLRDREVASSASDRQGSNFESCVWRTVSSQSSHHPQEVLLAQFSLYVHKGGLKPESFHFISQRKIWLKTVKLSSTISKVSFLCFDNQPASAKHQAKLVSKYDVSAKQIAGVIQMVEVAKERDKALAQVLCYDLFDSSPHFYGDPTSLRCTKPDREQLITELEQNLNPSDFSFNSASDMRADVIIDLMSKMRQYPDLTVFGNFGRAIKMLALTLLQR